jgi:3-methyl-2-oxobutanoate hydroxymethyltransferase
MRSLFTYGLDLQRRNLTLPDILANKAKGIKMTQATAVNGEEAAAVESAGIDMLGLTSDLVGVARAAAPNIYLIAAIDPELAIDEDDVVREAFRSMMAGADQIYTIRNLDIVERLAKEGFSVHGHVGLVPRKSIRTGGLRTLGKTADEAVSILDDLKRLEDAGAVAAEVECVADEAMAQISQHTNLITHAIGSGAGADVIFMFTPDICGEGEKPPRHAKAFVDLKPFHKAVTDERIRGLRAYKDAVANGSFPNEDVVIHMKDGESHKLAEALAKRPNV